MGDLLAEVSKESKCIVVSWLSRQLPAPLFSAAELPTSRPCTHGGRCSHLCAFLPLFLARFPQIQSLVARRALCSTRQVAATPFRLAAQRPPRRGSATATCRRRHLPLHALRPAAASRSATVPSRRSRRSPTATNTNWLCSTLLLFRCFFSSRDAPRASAGESPIAQGTKNPSASAAVSGFIHKRSRLA